ncbi:MAG: hypothetical protein Tsb0020_18650 [Haliangiales bacterium]
MGGHLDAAIELIADDHVVDALVSQVAGEVLELGLWDDDRDLRAPPEPRQQRVYALEIGRIDSVKYVTMRDGLRLDRVQRTNCIYFSTGSFQVGYDAAERGEII